MIVKSLHCNWLNVWEESLVSVLEHRVTLNRQIYESQYDDNTKKKVHQKDQVMTGQYDDKKEITIWSLWQSATLIIIMKFSFLCLMQLYTQI